MMPRRSRLGDKALPSLRWPNLEGRQNRAEGSPDVPPIVECRQGRGHISGPDMAVRIHEGLTHAPARMSPGHTECPLQSVLDNDSEEIGKLPTTNS